jgi:hypothetical protein
VERRNISSLFGVAVAYMQGVRSIVIMGICIIGLLNCRWTNAWRVGILISLALAVWGGIPGAFMFKRQEKVST